MFFKTKRLYNYASFFIILGVLIGSRGIAMAYTHFNVKDYLNYTSEETTLYADHYVDGRDITLTFPAEKRNLIYIFLESMETTYSDKSNCGAMENNFIPELTSLALENECFSGSDVLNGGHPVSGATFTMGALVAQTSGVPINENLVSNDTLNATWESENNYLPGVWSIGDILNEQGYHQEFMIGSDGRFAGRKSYFEGHGNYELFDYYTAINNSLISSDYKEWWGYEDKKLFSYAKNELTRLSKEDAPFNFTMLTADTHFTDGYYCSLCKDEFDCQYSNVIACSSRQVEEFVSWIQQQDFYDNTTIVICGDHLTMDSAYINKENADFYDRKTYLCIINGDATNQAPNTVREFTTLDLYPTTLAAMGVSIEGDSLGLGVNLYSGKPTLMEEYGIDYLNTELLKNSSLYTKKLLYGK